VLFVANPNYGIRAGKTGLPRIREIQFFESRDPVKDLKDGKVEMVLDLPLDKVADVKELRQITVTPPLPNRRVYFLAVNHRSQHLRHTDLRRALAHAIPRDKLLDKFRAKPGDKVHKPLNGPYPVDSWAFDPGLKDQLDLFKPALAKDLMKGVEAKGLKPARLSLKFPNDDPAVGAAMEYLKTHLLNELGLTIDIQGLEPNVLQQQVEQSHDYDLAYYSHDFADATYWLWPLFDPQSTDIGGTNYLSYANDSTLQKYFRDAMNHRDFAELRKSTHLIHRVIKDQMPLIPLWQLDRCVAFHQDVKLYDGVKPLPLDGSQPISLDPLAVFRHIESWRLEKK
jgi:ABC-type oligopeptide transport system substrate-binding subunit